MRSTRRHALAITLAMTLLAPAAVQSSDYTREQVAELLAALPPGQKADQVGRLNRLDFTGANLQGANLFSAKFQGANLAGNSLEGTEFGNALLRFTDLSGANLAGADVTGADATEANFEAARIAGATGLDTVRGLDRTRAR